MNRSPNRRTVLACCAGTLLAPVRRRPRAGLPEPADHDDRAVAGRRFDRPAPAHAGRDRRQALGQNVLIDNKPGAGGTLGPSTMALNAKPDGYTIAQYPLGMVRYPHMQKTNWHPIDDFTFIIGVSGYTFGFVVRADSPYKTFQDYIEAARKQPGKIDYGSTGIGTSPHLLIEEVSDAAKVKLNHVPYKGNADLMQALLGGHVMAASDATGWDKFVDTGRCGCWPPSASSARSAGPTCRPRRTSATTSSRPRRTALVGPKGMDPAVVKTLHDAFKKAMDDPKHMEVLAQLNQEPWYRSSDELPKLGGGDLREGEGADRAPGPGCEVVP